MSLSNDQKLALFTSLQSMLASGIPLLEALESIRNEQNKKQQKIVSVISEQIEQGNTLSESLGLFPESFDAAMLAVIKGAEEAGTLEQTLTDVVQSLEQQMEFEEKVKEAMTYPLFVLMVFVGVVLLMLLFVIPRIATIFDRLRVEIPTSTQFLVNVSYVLRTYPIPVVAVVLLLSAICWYLLTHHRRAVVSILFSLPVISQLGVSIDLARFFRTLSLLLTAGIPITESLGLAIQVVSNKKLNRELQRTQEIVIAGKTLSEGLTPAEHFVTPIVIRMINAGEKSGSLAKSSQQAATHFEKLVKKNLKRLTVLLEPMLILVLGVMVGGMMLSIIAPIYGLIGKIGGR